MGPDVNVDEFAVVDDTMMRNNGFINKFNSKQHKSGNLGSHPWIHPPGALQGAHVAYLVKVDRSKSALLLFHQARGEVLRYDFTYLGSKDKRGIKSRAQLDLNAFLGCTEVDSPKGIEVVKAGIQKMRFSSHLRRSEGSKIPKVELTISIDGVAIQEPKTKRILHQYPLYRISYCADDKAEKRFFCFIAKEENTAEQHQHRCFVFVSDRLAENITLTIGQAFDLAYRRFLETSGRELEMRKQILILQKRAKLLERENADLKNRISELECSSGGEHRTTGNVEGSDLVFLTDESERSPPLLLHSATVNGALNGFNKSDGSVASNDQIKHNGLNGYSSAPTLAAMLYENNVGERTVNGHTSLSIPPPPVPPRPRNGDDVQKGGTGAKSDLITLDPFAVTITAEEDPFGDFQKLFSSNIRTTYDTNKQFDEAIGRVDKRIADMREGFSRGLAMGKDDFTLESFDPLSKNSSTSHA